MPIYNVGDTGNKELVFGKGDIRVDTGYLIDDTSTAHLKLTQDDKRYPIGTQHGGQLQEVEATADVKMIFNNVDSVDTVIRALKEVRGILTGDIKRLSLEEARESFDKAVKANGGALERLKGE